jgi:uncharacterized protein (DUF952 family)
VIVLHLMPAAAWRAWEAGGTYEAASLATEGFVHCTAGYELMLAVANRFYGDGDDLVAVALEMDRLTSEVRWEAPAHPGGRRPGDDEPRFPHVYGPLDRAAVVGARRLVRDGDGRFAGYAPMV